MENVLLIENISKEFETEDSCILALDKINLYLGDNEILAIIGPSGCGKSTLLNIIAGLLPADGGHISYKKDEPVISYMLQSDALLPWRSVLDNATIGLELMRKKTRENVEKVKDMLNLYGLEDFMNEPPSSLSGGMKQRVALARSLAIDPDILLLDEPFSALDYYTRLSISSYVHDSIKTSGKSAIIITHDIAEAISMADRIIVLSSRPSHVKSMYDVDLPGINVLEKRSSSEFNTLFECIWRDLDDES